MVMNYKNRGFCILLDYSLQKIILKLVIVIKS